MRKALVISGEGINCEAETEYALRLLDFSTERLLLRGDFDLNKKDWDLLVLPGGFSFGDDLGSGRMWAWVMQEKWGLDFARWARQGKKILGICNGFQALIRMGVFGKDCSITQNTQGQFINRWVTLNSHSLSPGSFDLPIRHGEGRVIIDSTSSLETSERKVALRYSDNPNGSQDQIAGLTSFNGAVLGLMPHPEAFVRPEQHPFWTEKDVSLQMMAQRCSGLSLLRSFINA